MSARRMGSMMAAVKRNALQAWPWWLGFALMWPARYLPRTSLFFEAFPFFGAFQLLGCALAFLALLLAARPLWLLSDKAIALARSALAWRRRSDSSLSATRRTVL